MISISKSIHISFTKNTHKCTEESSFRIVVIEFSQLAFSNDLEKNLSAVETGKLAHILLFD